MNLRHHASLVRADVRYYSRRRRWRALVRALWATIALRYGSELCEQCGRRVPFVWWSPQPLWDELHGTYSGLLCPCCYDALARSAGIRISWTPMVTGRDGVATTNWWLDETRDALLMGEPDPGFAPEHKARQPQRTWALLKPLVAPEAPSPYPNENRAPESVATFPIGGEGT